VRKISKNNLPVVANKNSFKNLIQEVFSEVEVPFEPSKLLKSENKVRKQGPYRKFLEGIDIFAAGSILGESAWFGAEMMRNLFAVDENVYETLSHLAGRQLKTISDLREYIDNWSQNWDGGLSEKAYNVIEGHIAEQIVADHLRGLGHHVVLPDTSTQSGYDLIVDGIPVNVKNVADMSSVYEHFQKYPDIPVIVNYDVQNLPDYAVPIDSSNWVDQILNWSPEHPILVDNALSSETVNEHTHQAIDGIMGNIDFHIPFITVALSSIREIELLYKGHTDILTSAKNIGLDTLGIGVGGYSGAIIGNFIFPGIGTVLGALSGGYIGRSITNAIKFAPYKKALKEFERQKEETKSKIIEIKKWAEEEYNAFLNKVEIDLKEFEEKCTQEINDLQKKLFQETKEKYTLPNETLKNMIEEVTKDLCSQLDKISFEIRNIRFFEKYIWPSEKYINLKNEKNILSKAIRMLKKLPKSTKLTPFEKTNVAFEILSSLGFYEDYIRTHLYKLKNTIEENHKQLEKEIKHQKEKAAKKRIDSLERIKNKIVEIKEKVKEEIEPFLKEFKKAYKHLETEAKKLGFNYQS
jgi:gas vesicle protein